MGNEETVNHGCLVLLLRGIFVENAWSDSHICPRIPAKQAYCPILHGQLNVYVVY